MGNVDFVGGLVLSLEVAPQTNQSVNDISIRSSSAGVINHELFKVTNVFQRKTRCYSVANVFASGVGRQLR